MTLEISDEQQAIIDSKEDTIVISNPGAGKTTTLSLKVIDLLKNDVNPEKILCITYTAKAKKEMFDTIYKMAKEQGISDSKIMKINMISLNIISRNKFYQNVSKYIKHFFIYYFSQNLYIN